MTPRHSNLRALVTFLTVTFAATFVLHGAIAALGLEFSLDLGQAAMHLYLIGLAMPAVAAVAIQRAGARLAFLRASLLTRIRWSTLTAALLAQPLIIFLAWAMTAATGPFEAPRFNLSPGFALIAAGQIWVVLGEELGWRGFALPRLLEVMDARFATLALAAIWGLWHAPMFFVVGSLQADAAPWLFAASIFAWASIHTALYVRERPSLLANLVFHAAANLTLNLGLTNERLTPFLCAAYVFTGAATLFFLRRRAT